MQSLASHTLPGYFDEHSTGNSFTLDNSHIPMSLIAATYNPSLSIKTDNSLGSINSACNQGKVRWNYFESQSLTNALKKYDANMIMDTTYVRSVYAIVHALINDDPIAQQIAKLPILLPEKNGESVAKKTYYKKDGPLGFLLYIDLHAISTFCGLACLSQTAVDAGISLMCHLCSGIQILSS